MQRPILGGPFQEQALTDAGALMTCKAYVDLNPIRAGLATTLQQSDFTSIKQRIDDYRSTRTASPAFSTGEKTDAPSVPPLAAFAHHRTALETEHALPIDFASYLALVEWTGRTIRHGKKGAIPDNLTPILTQLEIQPRHWVQGVQRFNHGFHAVAGSIVSMQAWCERVGQRWLKGFSLSKLLFAKP